MVYLEELLRLFFKAETPWLSGTFLAKQLGVSRVSIGNFIAQLHDLGFKFVAVRGKGYQMIKEPSTIQEHWLKVHLDSLLDRNLPLWVFPEIDSTNQEAERQFANGRRGPFAIIGNRQTMGRGRLGSNWESQQDQNLYMTIGWQPRVSPENMPQFTLCMALSIAHFLRNSYQLPIFIKWPNDLMLLDRKVAGILVEARMETAYIHHLVFGLGLNINGDANNLPKEIRKNSITIHDFKKNPIPIHPFTASLIKTLLQSAEHFLDLGLQQDWMNQWDNLDYLQGKLVTVNQFNEDISGIACGITSRGQLKVKTKRGTKILNAGSVRLKKDVLASHQH